MAFTNNNKLRPIVVKAIAESSSPEAEKSIAWITISRLEQRLEQLDVVIRHAQEDRARVQKMRNDLLDNFPEGDEL